MWLSDLFKTSHDRRFFDLLAHHAALLSEAARLLSDYVGGGDPDLADRIAKLEQQGDEVLRQLLDSIRDTFITPLDRQDLYSLGQAIDDMLDYLSSAAVEFRLFHIEATPAMREMCGILTEAAAEVQAAVGAIATDPSVAYRHCRAASEAENRVEDRYRLALAELFDGDDFRSMFKTREIYRHLSNSADRADAAGKLIGKIIVKTA
jgi:uncharacterized protein